MGEMNCWVRKKIHLYNVTMGLYMLDWWERCLFNIMVLVLLSFVFMNGSRFATDVYQRVAGGYSYGVILGVSDRLS